MNSVKEVENYGLPRGGYVAGSYDPPALPVVPTRSPLRRDRLARMSDEQIREACQDSLDRSRRKREQPKPRRSAPALPVVPLGTLVTVMLLVVAFALAAWVWVS